MTTPKREENKDSNITTVGNKQKVEKANKGKHIGFRLTDEQYEDIQGKAASCGMSVSDYIRSLVSGFIPHLIMTDEQAKALSGFVAARSELVHFRNAFQNLPQDKRKLLFKNEKFMGKWLSYVNYLIKHWAEIKNHFQNVEHK